MDLAGTDGPLYQELFKYLTPTVTYLGHTAIIRQTGYLAEVKVNSNS